MLMKDTPRVRFDVAIEHKIEDFESHGLDLGNSRTEIREEAVLEVIVGQYGGGDGCEPSVNVAHGDDDFGVGVCGYELWSKIHARDVSDGLQSTKVISTVRG